MLFLIEKDDILFHPFAEKMTAEEFSQKFDTGFLSVGCNQL